MFSGSLQAASLGSNLTSTTRNHVGWYTCPSMQLSIYIYIVYKYFYLSIYPSIYLSVCIYICIYMYICIHIYVYVYVYIYKCMYIYIVTVVCVLCIYIVIYIYYPSICIHNMYVDDVLTGLPLWRPPSRLWQSPRPADRKATLVAANGPYGGWRSLGKSWKNHWKIIGMGYLT